MAPEALIQSPDISPVEADGVRVALAPNHTHFVLTQGEVWRAETPVMFDLAQAIAGKLQIVVMIGGGQVTLSEIFWTIFAKIKKKRPTIREPRVPAEAKADQAWL